MGFVCIPENMAWPLLLRREVFAVASGGGWLGLVPSYSGANEA
jgi:hypothetical protein